MKHIVTKSVLRKRFDRVKWKEMDRKQVALDKRAEELRAQFLAADYGSILYEKVWADPGLKC